MPGTKTAWFTSVCQGIFYFTRLVPSDLSGHNKASRIMFSLHTRSAVVVASRALTMSQRPASIFTSKAHSNGGTHPVVRTDAAEQLGNTRT